MKRLDYSVFNNPGEKSFVIAFFNESSQLKRFLKGVTSRYPGSKIDLVLSFEPRRVELLDYPQVEQVHIYRNLSSNPLSRLMGRVGFLKGLRRQNYSAVVVSQRGLKFYSVAMLVGRGERYIYLFDDERWIRYTFLDWVALFLRRLAAATVKGPFSYLFMLLVVISWGIARSFSHLWRGATRGENG